MIIWFMFIDIYIILSYIYCIFWVFYFVNVVLNDKYFIGYRGVLIC